VTFEQKIRCQLTNGESHKLLLFNM
jgi:hypothetical protein